jgi:hypothetical protein
LRAGSSASAPPSIRTRTAAMSWFMALGRG